MAGIRTSIEVQDRVSGALNRITATLYNATSAFGDVDRASDVAFNPSGVQAMVQEMYSYEARIEEIENDLVEANRRIEQMQNELTETKNKASGLEDAFSKVGTAIAAIGIGSMVKDQVSQAVDYASDLTEVQNVVDTVFGESSAVNDWSKNTLNAVGLNELSAKQFAGTMGAMLDSSGVAEDKIESMSMSIAELAGDMASFYNLDAEEAFNKIRSGISGETEPLKQLGINMSVANLEAYALANGIEASYSEMDQASQTMLRYAYLTEVTGNAQGDFARTQNSYANQTKLLKENWSAFTGELATNALPVLALGISMLNEGVGFIRDNWSVIQPILLGLLTMIGLYTTALLIGKAVQLGAAIATGIHTAFTGAWSVATFVQTAAQHGLNAALLACPITWIILLIIALIAVIVAVCAWIAKTQEVADSAFGVLAGGVNVVIQFFKNLGLSVANIALGIWNALGACAENIGIAFGNAISGVQSWFYDLLSTALTTVAGIAEALNKLPFIEFDYSGITDKAQEYADKAAEAEGSKQEYKSIGDAFNEGMSTFDTFQEGWVGDAYAAGAAWGDGVSEKVSSGLDGITAMLDTSNLDSAYTGTESGSVADMLSSISGDTSAISDSVDISNENLKYLRDVAERDVINKFTTAEIKVDMTNNNNISSGMDIDGIISALGEGLNEAMEQAAEGVHS